MKSSIKLSAELRRLLIHCEENCSADCCKESAFEINERTLRTWFDSERIDRKMISTVGSETRMERELEEFERFKKSQKE